MAFCSSMHLHKREELAAAHWDGVGSNIAPGNAPLKDAICWNPAEHAPTQTARPTKKAPKIQKGAEKHTQPIHAHIHTIQKGTKKKPLMTNRRQEHVAVSDQRSCGLRGQLGAVLCSRTGGGPTACVTAEWSGRGGSPQRQGILRHRRSKGTVGQSTPFPGQWESSAPPSKSLPILSFGVGEGEGRRERTLRHSLHKEHQLVKNYATMLKYVDNIC